MFESYGTEGLDLFMLVVAGLIGLVTALVSTHVMGVMKEDKESEHHEE